MAAKIEASGRHLEFPTLSINITINPIGELDPKTLYSRWDFVSILPTSWDIGTSSFAAAILDSHFRFGRTSFILVPMDYLTQKTRGSWWNLVSISIPGCWDLGVTTALSTSVFVCKFIRDEHLKKCVHKTRNNNELRGIRKRLKESTRKKYAVYKIQGAPFEIRGLT